MRGILLCRNVSQKPLVHFLIQLDWPWHDTVYGYYATASFVTRRSHARLHGRACALRLHPSPRVTSKRQNGYQQHEEKAIPYPEAESGTQGKCSVTTVAVSTVNGIRSSSDGGRYAESVITPYGYPFTYGVRLVNNGLLERYPSEHRLYTCGDCSPSTNTILAGPFQSA